MSTHKKVTKTEQINNFIDQFDQKNSEHVIIDISSYLGLKESE
jgi:hypothetical protein